MHFSFVGCWGIRDPQGHEFVGLLRHVGHLDCLPSLCSSIHCSSRNYLDPPIKGQQEMGPSWVDFTIFPHGIQTCQQIHICFWGRNTGQSSGEDHKSEGEHVLLLACRVFMEMACPYLVSGFPPEILIRKDSNGVPCVSLPSLHWGQCPCHAVNIRVIM